MNQLLVDTSSANHPGDADLPWDALEAAGIVGGIVKLTEGGSVVDGNLTGYVNPFGARDVAGFRARGMGVAGFHFLHASDDPVVQHRFITAHSPAGLRLVFIDAEAQGQDGLSPAEMGTVAYRTIAAFPGGSYPIAGLYTNLSLAALMAGSPWDRPFWLADPSHPNPSMACLIHQFGTRDIGGVTFDVNRFLGTDEQYATLFMGAAPVPAPPAPPVHPPAPTPLETLAVGSRGPAVVNLQRLLTMHGIAVATDGVFGPLTEAAVRRFQASAGLVVDGIVGAHTWAALIGQA